MNVGDIVLKRLLQKFKKIKSNSNLSYLKYLNLDIDEKLFLLEGGQGTNINGNMFSLLRELKSNPKYADYKVAFVVTDNKLESAKERMSFYGFDDVILTIRNSNNYCKLLATAKYLATDNSFPPYFDKREEQVFLNTWHGTPLKTLGKSDKSNLASLANIQKNYLMCDYALFPNEFTRDVFMKDYDLENLFDKSSIITNYPRNYVFYDKEQGIRMKDELGYSNKELIAYMPTWRGTGRVADTKRQISETMDILNELDERLNDNQVLLVNLHFLLSSEIDCSEFKHIESFSNEYDTYEILNACDTLITDYSSVFFDYAVTGKRVVLYAYDKEKYLSSRGTYIPFDELPFDVCETSDELINVLSKPYEVDENFLKTYCPNGWANSCERIIDLMINGEAAGITVDRHHQKDNLCVIYAGTIPEPHFQSIKSFIDNNPDYSHVILYRKNFNVKNKEFVLSLDDSVSTLGTLNAFQFKPLELISFIIANIFKIKNQNKYISSFANREARRLICGIKPSRVVDYSCGNVVMSAILSKLSGNKEFVTHGDFYCQSNRFAKREKFVKACELEQGFKELDFSKIENQMYIENDLDEFADSSFRRGTTFNNILPLYFNAKGKLHCVSLFKFVTPIKTRLRDTSLMIGDSIECKPKFFASVNRNVKRHYGVYSFSVPVSSLIDLPSNNRVMMCYRNKYNKLVQSHIIYFSLIHRIFLALKGPIIKDKETDTVAVFRQTKNNRLNIYVRSWIKSDDFVEHIKQDIAFVLACFWHTNKAKQLVLLYEKNSSKYEESASVLYEELINKGYKYAYFIVDRNYEYLDRIPQQYRKNIIYKYTFKHYLYFFKSKIFIGTEQIVHAIDLKTFNVFALKKIADKRNSFVFLQHGVMYMVSLDSESRGMFNRKKLKNYRVVVSSQAEADHFTELGRHLPEDLYICGLPKFDRNILSPDADKIVIMPTWRPWEINLARDDFGKTAYFNMVMKIYNSVPENLKDNVIILPHPLILNELHNLDNSIAQKMLIDARYDDVLKQTRVLITDYSSIAYDAFQRGSRVIFYWEEKDFCMQQYGPTTKLMLDEDNVYGDYFYDTNGLSEAIEENYNNPQKEEYIERFSKIVQFNDGKNTERLIQFLVDDGIIKLD